MDTISSRESNSNFLPMAGIGVGALALVFSVIALLKMSGVSKDINELKGIDARAKIEALEIQVAQVNPNQITAQLTQVANRARTDLDSVARQTSTGFEMFTAELTAIKGRLGGIENTRSSNTAGTGTATGTTTTQRPANPVAGPDEYVVKQGDNSGVIIARNLGVSLQSLMAVNPDVVWTKLRVGQKLKVPAGAKKQ